MFYSKRDLLIITIDREMPYYLPSYSHLDRYTIATVNYTDVIVPSSIVVIHGSHTTLGFIEQKM